MPLELAPPAWRRHRDAEGREHFFDEVRGLTAWERPADFVESDAAVLAEAAWAQEPLVSLLQSVLDVGEALASFGNCHFPEHSNEARAILAGDYRALLRQYLSSFGFAFAQPTKQQLAHDMQVCARALACAGVVGCILVAHT